MTAELAGIVHQAPAGERATVGRGGGKVRRPTPVRGAREARVGARDVAAVAALVVVPLLVYAIPAAIGHLVVPGDDLTQNLPLRELVGRDLRSGHLPVFDPYIWGGAPLLAGWNAGAAYPLTWLFAWLPGAAAWTVNLVAASVTAGVGCYAFLRASRLATLASWAGATTYAFGGGMVAQIPHVGLVIGMSWVPVALLALLRLTEPSAPAPRRLLWWSAVLAGAVGLVVLAGTPRAVTDAAAVLVLYALWRLVRLHWTEREAEWKAAAAVASGSLLGVGLGAVQLVPGLAAVATSQRAQVSAFLFGAGSLPVRWLALLGVPDLLGGSGAFGQPRFLGTYSLTEVTGYVGLLPLAAAVALLGRLRRHPLPEWAVWELVAASGILLALGNHTPLWHVLIRIPLFGGERLQSRGILVTDLALAVLLGQWLDGWARDARTTHPAAAATSAARVERALGALPLLGVIGLVVAALASGPRLLEWMGVGAHAAANASALGPWLVPSLVLAAGALLLVIAGARLRPSWRAVIAATFVVVDLVVFVITTVLAVGAPVGAAAAAIPSRTAATIPPRTAPATTTPTTSASRARPIASLHLQGRFAVYDPGLLYPSELEVLGVPDANAVERTWSIQGYGSIVDGHYAAATGVHGLSGTGQDVFVPRAAADGVLDTLSTGALLAPSQYLIGPAAATTSRRSEPGTRRVGTSGHATWFLGAPTLVRSARVTLRATSDAGTAPSDGVHVGLLTAQGLVDWARLQAPRAVEVGRSPAALGAGPGAEPRAGPDVVWNAVWRTPTDAVGLVVRSNLSADVAPPVVTVAGGRSYALDGPLQSGLVDPHWRYAGQDGAFCVFVDDRARPALSLRALAGRSLRGASVRRVSGPPLAPSAAIVSSLHGVAVVRAVAAVPGWTATWTPSAADGHTLGTPRVLAVQRTGVVQMVRAPAGRGVLRWRYVAPGLLTGEVLSAASLCVVAGLVVAAGAGRRGRDRAWTGTRLRRRVPLRAPRPVLSAVRGARRSGHRRPARRRGR